jgi:hypoxanthine phosphoribosyltransferase
MKEIFFDRDSVANGLTQIYGKLRKEGYHEYSLLAIGNGGKHVAEGLSEYGEFEDILSCSTSKGGVTISAPSKIKNKNILICEDKVNTGKTVKKIIAELKHLGASDIKFFSLIMKRNCSIVPNIFVFEVEEDTEVYFPWSNYPIRNYPKGIVRKIFAEDCSKTFECGDEKINTILTDYYNAQRHSGDKVYLVEDRDEICSILRFEERRDVNKYKGLFLKTIATATGKEQQGYTKTLLKLITLYMYYHKFDFIYGYAFDNVIGMYTAKGFDEIGSIRDNIYGKMHLFVMVKDKSDKEEVIPAIRKRI